MNPEKSDRKHTLELNGLYEGRTFRVGFDDEETATVADLAREVHMRTGLEPHRQRIEYKGIVFDPPDTDSYAPLLNDLNFRSGDHFDLSKSARALSEREAKATITAANLRIQTLTMELEVLEAKKDRVHQGFLETGNQLMTLANIRQAVDTVKEKLMLLITDLNALHLDHRNYEGQARRREAVDSAQRQIDKCVDLSATIFHKLAQSQQLAHTGRLYHADPLLTTARTKGNPKRKN